MALFQPLTTPALVPPVGTARETGTYDFKREQNPADQRELGKDVAAFANASGGIVLIGAGENRQIGSLDRYFPMTQIEAQALTVAYEQAVALRCHPAPVIEALPIEIGPPLAPTTGYVVAVNVYPMPLGPVGVRWDSDRVGPSFAFPLRTATQTRYLTPTELAMLTVPEIRRVSLMLDAIPPSQRAQVRFVGRHGGLPATKTFTFVEIDPLLTSVRIALTPQAAAEGKISGIPLDKIVSVYQHNGTSWTVMLDGYVDPRGDQIWYFAND